MAPAPNRPVVIAMKGHPGSGKTTLARAIAAAFRIPLLDKDDVRNSTLPLEHLLHGGGAGVLNDLAYDVLWRMTETQLQLGLSVVVDSPLSRRSHLDRLLQAAGGSAGVVVVECRAGDEAEWRRRLEDRGRAGGAAGGDWHKPATWAEMQALVESYGGCTDYDLGGVPKLVVDTTAGKLTTEEHVSAVIEFVLNSDAGVRRF